MHLPSAPAGMQSVAPFQIASHTMTTATTVEVCSSLDEIAPAAWDALSGNNPFLRHAFLHTLHETGCASTETGWTPQYLLLRDGGKLRGAMPLYLKSHSYGEYVFDWAWANAYEQHGLAYYPKAVIAVPFTPVPGSRLLARSDEWRQVLLAAALRDIQQHGASSLHLLLGSAQDLACAAQVGLMRRDGVQFHWQNTGCQEIGRAHV